MKTFDELGVKTSKMFDDLSLIVTSNLVSRINSMQLSGMGREEVRKVIVADLITGGRIFGQLRNGVKRISTNTIEEAGNIAAMKTFESKNYKEYKWITVGKNICPDCKPRHGTTGDISFFSNIGLPKSEFSVCGHNCKCQLVPVEYEAEDLSGPIKYKQPKPTDIIMGGKHTTKEQAKAWLEKNTGCVVNDTFLKLDLPSINIITREFRRHKKQGFDINLDSISCIKRNSGPLAYVNGAIMREGFDGIEKIVDTELVFNLTYFEKGDKWFRKNVGNRLRENGHLAKSTNTGLKYITNHELGHLFHIRHVRDSKFISGKRKLYKFTEKADKLIAVHKRYMEDMSNRLSDFRQKLLDKGSNWLVYRQEIIDMGRFEKGWYPPQRGKRVGIREEYVIPWRQMFNEVYGKDYISKYADENLNEFIAECFAEYNNNPSPSPYAVEVYNILLGVD